MITDPAEGLVLTGALAIVMPLLAYRQWRRQGLSFQKARIHAGILCAVMLLLGGAHAAGIYLLGLDRLSIGSYALAALLCVAAFLGLRLLPRRNPRDHDL